MMVELSAEHSAGRASRWFAILGLVTAMIVTISICQIFFKPTAEGIFSVFANCRLFVVHLAAMLPFAWASTGVFGVRAQRSDSAVLLGAGVAALAAVLTVAVVASLDSVSLILRQFNSGFAVRWLSRCSIACLITTPWLASVRLVIGTLEQQRPDRKWHTAYSLSWSALICFCLPAVYGWNQSEQYRATFVTSASSVRVASALESLNSLTEIGNDLPIQGKFPAQWRRELVREKKRLETISSSPLPANATKDEQLAKVMNWLSLGRFAESEQLLENLPKPDQQTVVLKALVAREKKNWKKVESLCHHLFNDWQDSVSDNPIVYQMLGEALMAQDRRREAANCYERAIGSCKDGLSDFEMRLADVLTELGDTKSAFEHFRQASTREPRLESEVKRRIRALKNNSCELRR